MKHQIEKLCDEITESGVERTLTEYPIDMNEIYLEMLQKIESKSSRTSACAEDALKLIMYAVRPLTSKELIEAISFASTVRSHIRFAEICLRVLLTPSGNQLKAYI